MSKYMVKKSRIKLVEPESSTTQQGKLPFIALNVSPERTQAQQNRETVTLEQIQNTPAHIINPIKTIKTIKTTLDSLPPKQNTYAETTTDLELQNLLEHLPLNLEFKDSTELPYLEPIDLSQQKGAGTTDSLEKIEHLEENKINQSKTTLGNLSSPEQSFVKTKKDPTSPAAFEQTPSSPETKGKVIRLSNHSKKSQQIPTTSISALLDELLPEGPLHIDITIPKQNENIATNSSLTNSKHKTKMNVDSVETGNTDTNIMLADQNHFDFEKSSEEEHLTVDDLRLPEDVITNYAKKSPRDFVVADDLFSSFSTNASLKNLINPKQEVDNDIVIREDSLFGTADDTDSVSSEVADDTDSVSSEVADDTDSVSSEVADDTDSVSSEVADDFLIAEEEAKAALAKAEEEARAEVEEALKDEEAALAKAEKEGRAKAEEEAARAKAEEARKAEETRKAEEEAARKAEEEARAKAEQEARAKAEQEEALKAAEALAKAEQEARAEVEEALKAAEEAIAKAAKASEEALAKAAEEARAKASEEALAKAAEEARAKASEEARAKASEEARAKASEEARAKASEEARAKASEEALKAAEARKPEEESEEEFHIEDEEEFLIEAKDEEEFLIEAKDEEEFRREEAEEEAACAKAKKEFRVEAEDATSCENSTTTTRLQALNNEYKLLGMPKYSSFDRKLDEFVGLDTEIVKSLEKACDTIMGTELSKKKKLPKFITTPFLNSQNEQQKFLSMLHYLFLTQALKKCQKNATLIHLSRRLDPEQQFSNTTIAKNINFFFNAIKYRTKESENINITDCLNIVLCSAIRKLEILKILEKKYKTASSTDIQHRNLSAKNAILARQIIYCKLLIKALLDLGADITFQPYMGKNRKVNWSVFADAMLCSDELAVLLLNKDISVKEHSVNQDFIFNTIMEAIKCHSESVDKKDATYQRMLSRLLKKIPKENEDRLIILFQHAVYNYEDNDTITIKTLINNMNDMGCLDLLFPYIAEYKENNIKENIKVIIYNELRNIKFNEESTISDNTLRFFYSNPDKYIQTLEKAKFLQNHSLINYLSKVFSLQTNISGFEDQKSPMIKKILEELTNKETQVTDANTKEQPIIRPGRSR
jgi:hypothetical protein